MIVMEASRNIVNNSRNGDWPGIVSRFQLVILAGRRSKQLLRGAEPRIVADKLKRRNTSIALEELKRGLLAFKPLSPIPNHTAAWHKDASQPGLQLESVAP